jgi:hypothetical protein
MSHTLLASSSSSPAGLEAVVTGWMITAFLSPRSICRNHPPAREMQGVNVVDQAKGFMLPLRRLTTAAMIPDHHTGGDCYGHDPMARFTLPLRASTMAASSCRTSNSSCFSFQGERMRTAGSG